MLYFLYMLYVQTCRFTGRVAFMLAVSACCPWPLTAAATAYTPAPFTDYQPIIDRMPFGALPPGFGQEAVAPELVPIDAQLQAEQQKLAKQINMSAVTVTPNGATAVGFTDLSEKPPVSYYLLVGDTGGGWTVLAADYDSEWAQIEKDGVPITIQLGKGLIDGPPPSAAAVAPAAVAKSSAAPQPSPADADPAQPEQPAEPPPPMTVQYARLRAIELAGGPPMPNVTIATIPQDKMAEINKDRENIRQMKAKGLDTRSYRERLADKVRQTEEQWQTEEQQKKEEMEEIARAIAQEELDKRQQEAVDKATSEAQPQQ